MSPLEMNDPRLAAAIRHAEADPPCGHYCGEDEAICCICGARKPPEGGAMTPRKPQPKPTKEAAQIGAHGAIAMLTDAQVDHALREHAGYDHQGVWRRCIQEIHFCIDDYGPPAR